MKKFTFAALAVPLMWVLLLLLFFNSNKIHAQETMILSGVVKSADGTPIEGVTVWQQDTDNGTQTNEQGFYTLSISPNAVIVFEYIGSKTQTVKASGSILNVTLTADDDTLEELVINAGYYSVKDKERTGSISKITSKEIGQQPVANPLAAMQGRMAGVNITQSSGTPGGGFDIQIRGRNSLRTEGNAPLYIVDGVPYASQSLSNGAVSSNIFSGGNVSPLNSINPNDIESIEVLKDADATAIYGSRGSNGVVLITTKKGGFNKTSVFFQASTGISQIIDRKHLMDTPTYLEMRKQAFANDGITDLPSNAYDINGVWDKNKYTDWQKQFIGRQAVSTNQMISISGGGSQTSYLISADNRTDGSVFPGDFKYNRTNFLMSVNHLSKDNRFNLQANMQKSSQKNRLMAADFSGKIYLAPNAPDLYSEDGSLNWEANTFENPMSALNARYVSESEDFMGRITMNYKVLDNLQLGVSAGLTQATMLESNTLPSTIYNPAYGLTSEFSSISQSRGSRSSWIVEPKANWFKEFENGKLDVLLGGTFESRSANLFSVQGLNFTSNDLLFNLANAATQKILADTETDYRYAAFFGRLNYTFLNKYILNATGRRDGSSRFGANNRFANFGAVGAAWLFSNEKLFENISFLNFGKLRGSYGIAGSDLIGDYQYLNTFGISSNRYNDTNTLEPLRLYNPDFSWETNKKLEMALELQLFNNRLAPTLSWYRNRSSNQLVGIPLPGTTGFNSVQANLDATVENSGWEFTLQANVLNTNDFKWSANVNVTIPKNKLLDFPNLEESTYANQYAVGEPITIRKVYNLLGVDKETGLYEFEDVNNDGKIDIQDRKTILNVAPLFYAGFQNSVAYKNISIDFLWHFVKQNGFTPDYFTAMPGSFNNQLQTNADYWTPENTDARYQKPSAGFNSTTTQAYENYRLSNGVIEKQYYLKLRSVQINYLFQKNSGSNFKLNVFLQAQNLITFSRYKGFDPETVGSYLPQPAMVYFGFNANF